MKLFDVYQQYDIAPVSGKGNWVVDKNNHKYLDFYGGHGVISIGHGHPVFVESLRQQIDQMIFYSNAVQNPLQSNLAEKLGKISGYPEYNLFLCNSGAEAIENALKIASFESGREKIITFSGGFHGRTSMALAASDCESLTPKLNQNSHVVKLPFNDIDSFCQTVNNDYAAVVIEGIQGINGIYQPDQEFIQCIRNKCDEYNISLIVDEIQSGYGRTGEFFAHQIQGISADIITTAKGMGNGFPIAGVLIHPKYKSFKGMLGTTFGGNHLACAAAISVLDVIKEEKLLENSRKAGLELANQMDSLQGIKEIRQFGLMVGVEMTYDIEGLREYLLETRNVFTGNARNKNTLRLLPPLNIGHTEIEYFINAITSFCSESKES